MISSHYRIARDLGSLISDKSCFEICIILKCLWFLKFCLTLETSDEIQVITVSRLRGEYKTFVHASFKIALNFEIGLCKYYLLIYQVNQLLTTMNLFIIPPDGICT